MSPRIEAYLNPNCKHALFGPPDNSGMPRKSKADRELEGSLAPPDSMGGRLRAERTARDPVLTQGALAEAAGISVQSISGLERGTTTALKPENLFPIADRLGVNPRWLATGKGPREPILELSADEGELIVLLRDLEPEDRASVTGYARGLQRKRRINLVPPSTPKTGT